MELMREKRLEKGLSQVELASKVGVWQSSITRFETGKATPKPSTAKKIAAILGFSWTKFYDEQEAK